MIRPAAGIVDLFAANPKRQMMGPAALKFNPAVPQLGLRIPSFTEPHASHPHRHWSRFPLGARFFATSRNYSRVFLTGGENTRMVYGP